MLINTRLVRGGAGGRAPFMQRAGEALELFERHGASTRMFAPLVAGEAGRCTPSSVSSPAPAPTVKSSTSFTAIRPTSPSQPEPPAWTAR
jgi:hypothetical protein